MQTVVAHKKSSNQVSSSDKSLLCVYILVRRPTQYYNNSVNTLDIRVCSTMCLSLISIIEELDKK